MANVYVREIGTDIKVKTIPTEKRGRALERMIDGLMRNMNLEDYYVDDSEIEEEED